MAVKRENVHAVYFFDQTDTHKGLNRYHVRSNTDIIYIKSFATAEREAFASDSEHIVLNSGWIPDAFAFLASRLLSRPLSSRVALAWLRRVFSRARISESRATDDRSDPELEGSWLGREDTEVLFSTFFGPGD